MKLRGRLRGKKIRIPSRKKEVELEGPRLVDHTKEKKGLLKNLLKRIPVPYKDPFVFFMRTDTEIDVIENVKPGLIHIKGTDGKQRLYTLEKNKMHRFPNPFGDDYRCWVVDEEEEYAYPITPVMGARLFHDAIMKLVANRKALEERGWLSSISTEKMILIMFGLIVLIGLFYPQIVALFGRIGVGPG